MIKICRLQAAVSKIIKISCINSSKVCYINSSKICRCDSEVSASAGCFYTQRETTSCARIIVEDCSIRTPTSNRRDLNNHLGAQNGFTLTLQCLQTGGWCVSARRRPLVCSAAAIASVAWGRGFILRCPMSDTTCVRKRRAKIYLMLNIWRTDALV